MKINSKILLSALALCAFGLAPSSYALETRSIETEQGNYVDEKSIQESVHRTGESIKAFADKSAEEIKQRVGSYEDDYEITYDDDYDSSYDDDYYSEMPLTEHKQAVSSQAAMLPLLITLFITLALIALQIVAMWRIFTKAGREGWKSLIPIYNVWVLAEIAGKEGWYSLLSFLPFVGIIFYCILNRELARSFGKGIGFAVGLVLLSPIFNCILAFSKDIQYALNKSPIPGQDINPLPMVGAPIAPVTPASPVTPATPATPITPAEAVTANTNPVAPITAPAPAAAPINPAPATAPINPAPATAPINPAPAAAPINPAPVTPATPVNPITPTTPINPAAPINPTQPQAPQA